MMKAVIIRLKEDTKQTLGRFFFYNGIVKIFECVILELPYLNNKKEVSCIPTGIYTVQKHISPKFGKVFKIMEVPGRSDVLMHKGNRYIDTKGCVLAGKDFVDIDGDDLLDINYSAQTINKMLTYLPDTFTLQII